MMNSRTSAQALFLLLLSGAFGHVMAQEPPLTAAERAAIEARIETLSTELDSLRQQLTRDQLQSDSGQLDLSGVITTASEQELHPVEQRRQLERESLRNPLSLTAHRRTHIFPLNCNQHPHQPPFTKF